MKTAPRLRASAGSRQLGFLNPWLSLVKNSRLVRDLTRRDISGRYRGATGGIVWSFLTPLLMLAVYSLVFGFIFEARWTSVETREISFPIVLFSGLLFANLLAECLNRAPGLILANANYVKKVVFPLEVLPWVVVGTALFHAAISVVVLVLALLITDSPIAPTVVFLPLLFLLFVPMLAGFTWMFAALGVFLRDLQHVVGILATALLFLAPVFYPRTMLAEDYRWLLWLNPLTYVVETARELILWNQLPSLPATGVYMIASLAIGWLGWVVFQSTRKGFADVV